MYWNISDNIQNFIKYEDGYPVSLAGRVSGFRRQGGIAFGHLQCPEGRIQFCFQKKILGEELFKSWTSQVKIGVHIGIAGCTWKSSTGEQTILVGAGKYAETGDDWVPWQGFKPANQTGESLQMPMFGDTLASKVLPYMGAKDCFRLLQNVWKGFPDKFEGISDPEKKLRLRYLDSAVNPETREFFLARSELISIIRTFLQENGFSEIETPTLVAQASGAMAKPFVTRHNALGADLYMRIAPETYLKRAVAAGLGPVFEIGKQFRNEGIDPSHLQEFTSLEWYAPYFTYKDNLILFRTLLQASGCSRKLPAAWSSKAWEWSRALERDYRSLFSQDLNLEDMSGSDLDNLFKREVRPSLVGPNVILDYPAHLSPMAARKPEDENTVEQWQFIVDGWELVKCYTELTDPVLQRKLLEQQMAEKANGNEETMALEEDFLECMEYGMPPMSGLGLGIDRLVCLLSGESSLRNVVLFPTLLGK
jgi:lysyl-tRNA synthetase, class II